MKKIIIFICLILTLGCTNQPQNINQKVTKMEINHINKIAPLSEADALKILNIHCYTCHSPNSESHDNMLAPPLAGIKYKYKQLYHDRSEFIAKMSDFIIHPSKENAVMKGPVRRFGLMPKTTLVDPKEVLEIVAFIYDNPLIYPEWFPEHFQEEHGESWKKKHKE